MPPRLVVGLTGGIGTGKSAVTDCFVELGVPVLDADALARELVAPGQPALRELVKAFGTEVLDADGNLDRRRMREIVFRDPNRRKRLESILHPLIRREMEQRVRRINAPYCVLSIPLLLETQQTDLVDRVLVVDAPAELQIERVQTRDGTPRSTIEKILNAQLSREARFAAADDIIRNDSTRNALRTRVHRLHRRYLRLSGADLPPNGKS